jgi:hypothetical protein
MMIWSWEFLRRNHSFRDFWVRQVEPFIMTDGRIGRDQTGRFWPCYKEMQQEFGISDPWSPRQNNRIPAFCDLATTFAEAPAVTYASLPANAPAPEDKERILENSQLPLSRFEMGFAIDLRLPLDDQLKAIRILAGEDQRTLKGTGLVDPKVAKASDKYVLYLRILDAEDAGIKRSAIADVLFPEIDNDHPDYRRRKTCDNARIEARRLRDCGYRALAFRAKAPLDATILK